MWNISTCVFIIKFMLLFSWFVLQASLNKLMETLGQSEPYFVKCIRSNAEKVKCAPSRLGPHLTLLVFKAFFNSFEAWTFLNLFIAPTPPLAVASPFFLLFSLIFPPLVFFLSCRYGSTITWCWGSCVTWVCWRPCASGNLGTISSIASR